MIYVLGLSAVTLPENMLGAAAKKGSWLPVYLAEQTRIVALAKGFDECPTRSITQTRPSYRRGLPSDRNPSRS